MKALNILCCVLLSFTQIKGQSCHELNTLFKTNYTRLTRDSSIRLANKAVRVCSNSIDTVGYIISLYNLTESYYETNLKDSNLKYATKAIEVYQVSSFRNTSFYGRLLLSFGDALEKNDLIDSAFIIYNKTKSLLESSVEKRGPDSNELISIYLIYVNSATQFYMNRHKFYKAEKLFEEAFHLIEKSQYQAATDYNYFLAIESYGGLQLSIGQYDDALVSFQKAKVIFTDAKVNDSLLYAALMDNIGAAYLDKGQYPIAYPFFKESLDLRTRWSNKQDIGYSKSLNNMATIDIMMGRYDAALPPLMQLDSLTAIIGKNSPEHINALNSLATTYAYSNLFKKAEEIAKASLSITRNHKSDNPSNFAFSFYTSGEVFRVEKEHKKSIRFFDSSLMVYKTIPVKNLDEIIKIKNNLATEYENIGEYGKAIDLYRQIISEHKILYPANTDQRYVYLSNLVVAYAAVDEIQTALQLMPECFTGIRQYMQNRLGIQSDDEKQTFVGQIDNILQIFKSLVSRGGRPMEIKYASLIYNNELMMKQFLLSSNQKTKMAIERSSDTTLLNLYINWKEDRAAFIRPGGSFKSSERSAMILKIRQEERELSRLSQIFNVQLSAFNANWSSIHDSLKSGEILMDFFFYHEYSRKTVAKGSIRYGAFVIKKNLPAPVWVDLFSESDLDKMVTPHGHFASEREKINSIYGSVIDSAVANQPENANNEHLFTLIWKPLLPYLTGIRKIYFIPVRNLGAIALTSLHQKKMYLIEKYEMEQLQNGLEVCEVNNYRTDVISLTDPTPQAELFGAIKYNYLPAGLTSSTIINQVDSSKFYDSLPMTGREIALIDSLLKDRGLVVNVFTGEEASEEELKSLDGHSPAIIQIATHGFFRPLDTTLSKLPDPLTRSALLLAHGNYALGGGRVPDHQEDGIFNASEASLLDFRGTRLIVLSACETGVGEILASEGIFSLQRGFKIAGVGYIMVSLWKISEDGTFIFMQTFYKYLCSGETIEQAFRMTQLDMKKTYNPYYWGAFTLVH